MYISLELSAVGRNPGHPGVYRDPRIQIRSDTNVFAAPGAALARQLQIKNLVIKT